MPDEHLKRAHKMADDAKKEFHLKYFGCVRQGDALIRRKFEQAADDVYEQVLKAAMAHELQKLDRQIEDLKKESIELDKQEAAEEEALKAVENDQYSRNLAMMTRM